MNNKTAVIYTNLDQHESEELKAFAEAIRDPETRKAIISILEEAGLLPVWLHQPA